jgi:hypothetical protein
MASSPESRRPATVALALGALLCLLAGPAAPARAEDVATLPDVLKALKVDELPMHYVILVDSSGSMRGERYARAVASTRSLIGALAPSDRLTLIGFNKAPTVFHDDTVANGAAAHVDKMATQPPTGSTDIGFALAEAVRALGPPATSPAVIVLLTDAVEEPPDDSRYADPNGKAWQQLRADAEAVRARRPLRVYPVPLNTAQDADAAFRAFPGDTVVRMDLPPEQFQKYLDTLRDSARADKAREYLRGDDTTVEATVDGPARIPAGGGTVRVRLISRAKYVPLTVTGLNLDVGALPISVTGLAGPVTLAPGETRTVALAVANHGDDVSFGGPPHRDGDVRATGTVGSSWGAVLTGDLRLGSALRLDARPGRADVVTGWSWPAWSPVAAAAVLLLIWFGLRAVVRYGRADMSGILVVIESPGAPSVPVNLSGRRKPLPRGAAGLHGRGSVVGRRQRTRAGRPTVPKLVVRYRGKGGRGSCELRPGATDKIGTAVFRYRASA